MRILDITPSRLQEVMVLYITKILHQNNKRLIYSQRRRLN